MQGGDNKATPFTHKWENVQNFLWETLNLAVLDGGCTKTECGEQWLKCYVESLCDDNRHKWQEFNSNTELTVWR